MKKFLWALKDMLMPLAVIALFVSVNLLPPDSSFAQIQKVGLLRACIPDRYPPLVTRDVVAPGIDVDILQVLADELGLRLLLNTNTAMGRDVNPRNWRVTRAQCQILAGGVVGSRTTRSFLETTPPHLETGWALILPNELLTLEGVTVGFYAGVSGLDRIALSRFLRQQGTQIVTVHSVENLAAGLEDGRFDVGVSEALTARQIAGDNEWQAQWLPEELGRHPIVFGLWKGDLTLKREIVGVMNRLKRSGVLTGILERYELAPIAESCTPCR